jgi:ferrous iron transport protein A
MVIVKNVDRADADEILKELLLKNEENMDRVTLAKMKSGQSGTVVQIEGGHGIQKRLDSMGIRLGSKITKVSSQLMRGPVTIALGNLKVALGFGMANKIIVDLKK